jgi:hypothetical protein
MRRKIEETRHSRLVIPSEARDPYSLAKVLPFIGFLCASVVKTLLISVVKKRE